MNAGAAPGWTAGQLLLDPSAISLGTSGAGSAPAMATWATTAARDLSPWMSTRRLPIKLFPNHAASHRRYHAGAKHRLEFERQHRRNNRAIEIAGGRRHRFQQRGGNPRREQLVGQPPSWREFFLRLRQPGAGNIFLNGGSGKTLNGIVQTGSGAIDMTAGESILVGTGAIRTTGGGAINLNALAGDINAGTANGGYQFSIFGAAVSSALGGIATAAGGDVTLQAGDDIISVPTVPANQPPGASGAYGSQPGDVRLIAGNQVVGNFTVANGTGTILAGAQVNNGQGQILNAGASVGTSPTRWN